MNRVCIRSIKNWLTVRSHPLVGNENYLSEGVLLEGFPKDWFLGPVLVITV